MGRQRAGIEVHESGVRHGGAGRQVSAEAHAVGVADTHAGGHYVIDHTQFYSAPNTLTVAAGAAAGSPAWEAKARSGFGGGAFDVGLRSVKSSTAKGP